MELICIQGAAPGRITATVAHGGDVRQLPMEVVAHEAGGWKARSPGGSWGLRCHAVATAILMEASEVFAGAALVPEAALAAD